MNTINENISFTDTLKTRENRKKVLNRRSRGYRARLTGASGDLSLTRTTEVFDGTLTELEISIPQNFSSDVISFLKHYKFRLINLLKNHLKKEKIIRFGVMINFIIVFTKQEPNNEFSSVQKHHISTKKYIISISELSTVFEKILQDLIERIYQLLFNLSQSGIIITSFEDLKITYHKSFVNGNVLGYKVKYPKGVRGAKLVYNPIGEDDKSISCFVKCISAFIASRNPNPNPTPYNWTNMNRKLKSPQNVNRILKTRKLDLYNINYDDFKKWENELKIRIICYEISLNDNDSNKHKLALIRLGNKKFKKICNLVIYKIKEGNENSPFYHCVLIKDSMEKYIKTFARIRRNSHVCKFCFSLFDSRALLKKHVRQFCMNKHSTAKYKFPVGVKKDFRFHNFKRCSKYRYVLFFDFEAMMGGNDDNESIHIPISVSSVLIDTDNNNVIDYFTYTGIDCVNEFLEHVLDLWYNIAKDDNYNHKINWTINSLNLHKQKTKCDFCSIKFDKEGKKYLKTAHHDHGKRENNYVASLCVRCNFQTIVQKQLICIAHNANYDISLIIKYSNNNYKMEVLPQKSPLKYYYLRVKKKRVRNYNQVGEKVRNPSIKIIDSYQFLKSSLSTLVFQFIKDNEFNIFNKVVFQKYGIGKHDEIYGLLTSQKGNFPFSYLNSVEKLSEKELPRINAFYNELRESKISLKDYENSVKIFNLCRCNTLSDYLEIYCLSDVLFLADIFLHWREVMFENYELDVVQYLTLSSYSLDSMLLSKYKENPDFKLGLIDDEELYIKIVNNIRGGFCTLLKHHAEFKNVATMMSEMSESNLQNLNNTMSDALYLDINSQYATAMTEKLPVGNFRKLFTYQMKDLMGKLKNNEIDFQNECTGYFFEVDFKENNVDVQDKTDEFPFALENAIITDNQISDYTKSRIGNQPDRKYKRLIGNHFPKSKMLVNSENLQYYLKHGLEVSRVYNVYAFDQETFLKPYIDRNIENRKNAKTKSDSSLFKLMNNGCFGKFLSNQKNYAKKVCICSDKSMFIKKLCSNEFINLHILNPNKVVMYFQKNIINCNFPHYVGFMILEIARKISYKIYYEVLYPIFKNNSLSLIYSDTDSFIISYSFNLKHDKCNEEEYFSKKNEIVKRIYDAGYLDTSNYNKDHPLYNETLKSKLGLLKNEFPSSVISEFIGLAPKVYSFAFSDYHVKSVMRNIGNSLRKYGCKIDFLYNDLESSIFVINIDDTIFKNTDEVLKKCETVNILLENYHNVQIKFEKYLELSNDESNKVNFPKSRAFYDKDIFSNVLSLRSDIENIFYFEINSSLNINIYKYALNYESRPIPDKKVMSDTELLILKSKTCAGVPEYKSGDITFHQYKSSLGKKRDELTKVTYKLMKNDKGVYKTVSTTKLFLIHNCVKRFFVNDSLSYSYGHYKIPAEKNIAPDHVSSTSTSNSVTTSDFSSLSNDSSDSENSDDRCNQITQKSFIFNNRLEKRELFGLERSQTITRCRNNSPDNNCNADNSSTDSNCTEFSEDIYENINENQVNTVVNSLSNQASPITEDTIETESRHTIFMNKDASDSSNSSVIEKNENRKRIYNISDDENDLTQKSKCSKKKRIGNVGAQFLHLEALNVDHSSSEDYSYNEKYNYTDGFINDSSEDENDISFYHNEMRFNFNDVL